MKVSWLVPTGSQENRASCSSNTVDGSEGGSEQGRSHSPWAPNLPPTHLSLIHLPLIYLLRAIQSQSAVLGPGSSSPGSIYAQYPSGYSPLLTLC